MTRPCAAFFFLRYVRHVGVALVDRSWGFSVPIEAIVCVGRVLHPLPVLGFLF
jgi:hypothetical protein